MLFRSDDLLENRLWRMIDSEISHEKYISISETLEKVRAVDLKSMDNFIDKWILPTPRLLIKTKSKN